MIPIYRAKKINSDEYVQGYYIFDGICHYLLVDNGNLVQTKINPSTLAIHFNDMLDSKGTKIFASLNESGKGGDIANIHIFTQELGENLGVTEGEREFKATFIFNDLGCGLKTEDEIEMLSSYGGIHEESFKVIEIQE